ncbi:MAG: PfkB family carbohydrate kinase [Candidatus Bathyarchaeia archaeon]
MRLLSIGDNCIDDYVELGVRFPGGNALNVAVYANRIEGVEADYIGVVGDDEAGDFMLESMRAEGLSTDGVLRSRGATAVTSILIRDGDRVFASYDEGVQRGAVFPKGWLSRIQNYDVMHFTVWGFGRELIPEIRRRFDTGISCDFSSEYENPALEALPFLDYSFFSGSKLVEEGESPEERLIGLKGRTPGVVVLTLGEHGSMASDGGGLYRGEALKVDAVDTLGAGDAFIAAFLASAGLKKPIQESLRMGHLLAASACGRLGAWGEPWRYKPTRTDGRGFY